MTVAPIYKLVSGEASLFCAFDVKLMSMSINGCGPDGILSAHTISRTAPPVVY